MLEVIVFCSGALVMILEMVGARVMAPHLGTSVIVWTSLIGIVLACLALGAWLGGRLADKKLSFVTLGHILAGAGAGCVLTALIHPLVGGFVSAAIPNIYAAAVVAALCLFTLPAALFGMVSPYIIRLRLADIATSGATVGRLYALSTAGSILGAFLGGFVLVSFFPSTQILLGTGGIMFVLSLAANRKKPVARALLLALTLFAAGADAAFVSRLEAQGLVPPLETPYSTIQIADGRAYDNRPIRLMSTGPGYSQSGMYLDRPAELLFRYTKHYELGTALVPDAKQVLMLGGGGYSVPKWLLAGQSGLKGESLRLDVVELDPGMTEAARRYFALPDDPRMTIAHQDARRFINTNRKSYDLVFVDVFNSHYSVPFHMGTVEAAAALRRAVAPGGALLMNVISAYAGEDARLLQSIHGALGTAFPEIHVFAVDAAARPQAVQNFMVLAFPEARPDLAPALLRREGEWSAGVSRLLASRIAAPLREDVPPLRDELAPVERYAQALLKN